MKTLNPQKSEELWNEIKNIEYLVSKLGGCVQNPDFVNEENVGENFIYFDNDYKKVVKRLDALRENMILLHKRVKNF